MATASAPRTLSDIRFQFSDFSCPFQVASFQKKDYDLFMQYNFEKLKVWQESRVFVKEIYQLVNNLPKNEQFVLGDQIRRAAISIALNISEGADKKSNKDFIRFLRISLGSINETVTCLYIALDLNYIDKNKFLELYEFAHKLSAMLNALVRKLNE